MLPIHKLVFYKTTPRFSKEAEVDIFPVAKWFGEEKFTYIRVLGRISSPHVLSYYFLDKLIPREITYQIEREGGLTRGLKNQKKAIWPTFSLQFGAFSLQNYGHALKEA